MVVKPFLHCVTIADWQYSVKQSTNAFTNLFALENISVQALTNIKFLEV